MTPYIPIAGTWWKDSDKADHWYRHGSAVDGIMRDAGFARVDQNRDPMKPDKGYWSGDLGGTLVQWALPWVDQRAPWTDGAADLARFLLDREDELQKARGVLLMAHSHGGQVVALCLSQYLDSQFQVPIHVLTVDTPLRRGMRSTYRAAVRRSASWTHLYTGWKWGARMRVLGSRFNGPRLIVPGPEGMRVANYALQGGHSGVLFDPLHRWQLTPFLRGLSVRAGLA